MARNYVDLYRRLADDADLGAGIAAGAGAAWDGIGAPAFAE
jgi:hypothetical protein